MLIWDTTPIIKCVDKATTKVAKIDAAINWDELSNEKKRILTDAKSDLYCSISWAKLQAEDGHVGHSVDIDRNIQELHQAQDEYLNHVRQVFPYQDIQNAVLFNLLYDEEWLGKEKERIAQMWQQKRQNLEIRDNRYKCCKNGHCFKSTERFCPWCGEMEEVDRVNEKTLTNTIDLYVGHPYERWGLTKNQDIEGKNEQIRKITVDLVGKYKLYYHLDGQNPNPFCNNSIKLGDQCIEGRRIVQLCDELIDGNKDTILI